MILLLFWLVVLHDVLVCELLLLCFLIGADFMCAGSEFVFVVFCARLIVNSCTYLHVLLINCLLFVLGWFLVEFLLLFNSDYLLMLWFVLFTINL